MTLLKAGLMAATLCSISAGAHAQNHDHHSHHGHHDHHHHGPLEPMSIMGGHVHGKGEWMLSYRYMHMNMDGNRNGTDDLSPEEVITFANPNPGPTNLRVVPTEMTMDMHMLGAMYAPLDWLTLMAMGMYVQKEMDHITFNMAGTAQIGTFTTKTSGFGDSKVSGLMRVYKDDTHQIHLNAGLSLPTGSIDEEDDVLTPMNTRPTLRTPYAMQLGTGTYDLHPGITYNGHAGAFGWGAQYMAEIRLEDENDEGYAWGDKHQATFWGGYQAAEWISLNATIKATTQNEIDGSDPLIAAPVQTADPDNYGGDTVSLGAGFDIGISQVRNVSIGANLDVPVYQDLNGPQLETDWIATGGLKVTF